MTWLTLGLAVASFALSAYAVWRLRQNDQRLRDLEEDFLPEPVQEKVAMTESEGSVRAREHITRIISARAQRGAL